MSEHQRLKRYLYAGAAAGAVLSVVVTVLMDSLYAGSLGGTWREAIAIDLKSFFSLDVPPESALVAVVYALILAAMAGFGALMGCIFAYFFYKFFNLLAGNGE